MCTLAEQQNANIMDIDSALVQQLRTFSPDRGEPDTNACAQIKKNGGFWGPGLDD